MKNKTAPAAGNLGEYRGESKARKHYSTRALLRDWFTAGDDQFSTVQMIIPGACIIALAFIGCAVLSALHIAGVW